MRIAYFTETFLPKVDGIVNTLCQLLDHLERRGHASLLFAPEGGPERYAATPVVGLGALPFPLYPELRLVPPIVDVSKTLQAFQPELIHVINPTSLGLIGLWQSRQMGIPVVASYHTDVPGFATRWGMGYLNQAIWSYFRWLHNQADLNLAPSRFTQEQLIAQQFRNVKVWTRGVDTTRFHPLKAGAEMRRRLGSRDDKTLQLIYVGRLAIEKRVELLHAVVRQVPGVSLAIVGDGPQRPALERMFAGTPTTFTGYLRGDELAQAYASADIFTFTGANETFGNVVLEAMASGLPVVAPGSGGVLDHTRHGENGLLFEPENADHLVACVRALKENPDLQLRLGRAGRMLAENQSWESVLDLLIEDYTNLLPETDEHQLPGWFYAPVAEQVTWQTDRVDIH